MKRLRGQGGFFLVTMGALAAGLGAIPGAWWLVIPGAALTLWGIILQLRLDPSYSALAKREEVAMQRAASTADSLQVALESLLRRIATHCRVNEVHQRISIYCFVAGEFIILARESASTRLAHSGRTVFPGDEGVIGEAWDLGESLRRDWPEDRDEWNALQNEEYGISLEVVKGFTMQPRSLAAMRLTHDNSHVGVMVMESTQPRGVMKANLSAAKESLLMGSLCELLLAAQPNFPAVADYLKQPTSSRSESALQA